MILRCQGETLVLILLSLCVLLGLAILAISLALHGLGQRVKALEDDQGYQDDRAWLKELR